MGKVLYFFVVFILFNATAFSQKNQIENYNNFINSLNVQIDYINQEQQKLQQYHQDIYRFYRLFDTLQVSEYAKGKRSQIDIEVPSLVQEEYAHFYSNLIKLDSVTNSIQFHRDIEYTKENVEHFNDRIAYLTELYANLHMDISNFQEIFSGQSISSRKKSYLIMLEEIEKIEFQISQYSKKKITLQELQYSIPVPIMKKLPPSYLKILKNYESRVDTLARGMSKEDLIHYFMPEKYFDKWITKKYSLRYWQVQYLQDVLVNPIIERGLKTYYNTSVKNYALQTIKNVNEYSSLPYEYTPISDSPLGNSQKIFFILILDISNSMNEFDKLSTLKSSVNNFVDALRPQDKFAILLFSNTSYELVLPSEKDKEYIKYTVNNIKAQGNTLPESAIFKAYNIYNLQDVKGFKNQIILITDGVFNVTGKMKYHINKGKKDNIRFSIIQIEPEEESYKEMEKLTQISDGTIYFVPNSETYKTIIEEILR